MAEEAWYSTGYKKAREAASENRTDFFGMKDGETVKLRFLSSEPVNIYEHGVRKGSYRSFTCMKGGAEECPLCERMDGDKSINKRFVGCFSVLDRRDGKVKQYRTGIKVLRVLDKFSAKYGSLIDRDYEIARTGSGTETVYNFIPESPEPLTAKEKALKLVDFKTLLKPKTRKAIVEFLDGTGAGEDAPEDAPRSKPAADDTDDGPPADAEVVETGDAGVRF